MSAHNSIEPVVESILADRRSSDSAIRLRALAAMRKLGDSVPNILLAEAFRLIDDENNDCRWQAVIVIGNQIERDPSWAWQAVETHGHSSDEDMRDAIACVLLEHLLEHYFDRYLELTKGQIAAGKPLLADTLERCWPFGEAAARWIEVKKYLRTLKVSRSQTKRREN